MDISPTQQMRVNKIARLREYFKTEVPQIYEWTTSDEGLDFSTMCDAEISAYLEAAV